MLLNDSISFLALFTALVTPDASASISLSLILSIVPLKRSAVFLAACIALLNFFALASIVAFIL